MERLVDDRLKRHNTAWDTTCFERGRWDILVRIRRIEEDLTHLIESLKETPR